MLTQAQLTVINDAVAEGLAFISRPLLFLKHSPTAATDPLYGEESDGINDWIPYATLVVSVRERPQTEELTRMGLRSNADLLAVIPRAIIKAWETANSAVFTPTETMLLEYEGARYNVEQIREDEIPIDGGGVDFITMAVTGRSKPRG